MLHRSIVRPVTLMTLACFALGARVASAGVDEAWLGRLDQLVGRLERQLHEVDGRPADAFAALPSRLRALDERIATLERRQGMAPGHLHLYGGDNETRQLESWTQAATRLDQRARAAVRAKREADMGLARTRRPRDSATSGSTATASRRPAATGTTRQDEGPIRVQSYDRTRNRTVIAVTAFQVAEQLWHEVSIEFQHEPGSVDVEKDDPSTWPVQRLLTEAELLDHVNNLFSDRNPAIVYPVRGWVEWTVGALEDPITIRTGFVKDGAVQAMLEGLDAAEVRKARFAAADYVRMIARTQGERITWIPMGTLHETPISMPKDALELITGVVNTFKLRDALQPRDGALTPEGTDPAPATDVAGGCSAER